MTTYFKCTNESLVAIIESMELTRNDNVLAICGSGDPTFAMCEYAGSVTAIDNNLSQKEYAKTRAKEIQEGMFYALREGVFFPSGSSEHRANIMRNTYFRKRGRMKNIRANIHKISFVYGDIFKNWGRKFSRIYLSNAHQYLDNSDKWPCMQRLAECLKSGGLLYAIDGSAFSIESMAEGLRLEKEVELSRKAGMLEPGWNPKVFRRKA